MLIKTKHFTIYKGYDLINNLDCTIQLALWPISAPAPGQFPHLACIGLSWNWLPTLSWIDHEYRIPAKADASHIPASLWTGRRHSLAGWRWPLKLIFQPVTP